ncbi:MAG: hypothetical protein NWE98_02620 [Candidatus Bathyarchaeota archaeon]|nr:hypothetical protein [Candidatus Bathyarchaeota archaeon]
MSFPLTEIIKAIPTAIQVYKDLKSVFNDSRKDIEQQNPSERWATYINPIHSFKISWPTQRWAISEIGNIGPYVYMPAMLSFKLASPIKVSRSLNPTGNNEIVPNVNITIDLNGGIEMSQYVKVVLEGLSSTYKSAGADFFEDFLGKKIEADNAVLAYHVKFPEYVMWQVIKIRKSQDKMYSVCGTVIEGASGLEIAVSEIPKIMNSVAILQNK